MPKTYVIPTEGGEKEELNVDCQPSSEEGIKSVYETRIPEKFNQYPYLLLYREIEERGYDHWTNFHWTSLTPCDGITFTLKCFDDIIIKDHLIFDEKSCAYSGLV